MPPKQAGGRGRGGPSSSYLCAKAAKDCNDPHCQHAGMKPPKKPCKYGAECKRPDCSFQHPEGWNPHASTHAPPPPPAHLKPINKPCNSGINCTRVDCKFKHPENWNPLGWAPPANPPPPPQPTDAPPHPKPVNKPCNAGINCKRVDCKFKHPDDWNPTAPQPAPAPPHPKPANKPCRDGRDCKRADCKFEHPPDWKVAQKLQPTVIIKSQPLGKSLYFRMMYKNYYGDDLEQLKNEVGAPVTYLEGECRLRTLVPADRASHAFECLNRAVETSRPRLTGESNELNLVGSTRVVVGRGGQVLCVLPGRDCRAIDALQVPTQNGQISDATMQQAKDIMGRFVVPSTHGPAQPPSIQRADTNNPDLGKLWISFNKPEEAEAALNAYPKGPWKQLKPFIQSPREGTLVQVLQLKVKYPLLPVPPKRERQVIIYELVAPFGVRMHDIEMSKGNKDKRTGTARINMGTKGDADAALQSLQNYARQANELAPSPGQLVVKLKQGFMVPVSGKQFKAVQSRLEYQQRMYPCIRLKLPKEGRNYSIIKLQDDSDKPSNKETLLAARNEIEKILRGSTFQLDRNTLQAMSVPDLMEQLKLVETEHEGKVAIIPELECSRFRLFGQQITIDRVVKPLLTVLVGSLAQQQVRHLQIPPATRAHLLRGLPQSSLPALRDSLQTYLRQLADVTVQTVTEDAAAAGSAEAKVVGVPAALQKASRGFLDLQIEARSSSIVEWVDSSKPPPGKECAICFCEIEPAERYLMEPCLHAYHQECAVRSIESDMEKRKLPIMCHHQGCSPQPLCLEDIKLLLADATKFETLCTRALLLHVSQSPELERCPAVDCKQVFKTNVNPFACNRCLGVYCTQCNGMPFWHAGHEGLTCKQFQDKLKANSASSMWVAENTRQCGNCHAPFFKLSGCNHLVCGSCKHHLCNLCGQTFGSSLNTSSTQTYQHLRAVHGGIYT